MEMVDKNTKEEYQTPGFKFMREVIDKKLKELGEQE